jgi:hypothetical protein
MSSRTRRCTVRRPMPSLDAMDWSVRPAMSRPSRTASSSSMRTPSLAALVAGMPLDHSCSNRVHASSAIDRFAVTMARGRPSPGSSMTIVRSSTTRSLSGRRLANRTSSPEARACWRYSAYGSMSWMVRSNRILWQTPRAWRSWCSRSSGTGRTMGGLTNVRRECSAPALSWRSRERIATAPVTTSQSPLAPVPGPARWISRSSRSASYSPRTSPSWEAMRPPRTASGPTARKRESATIVAKPSSTSRARTVRTCSMECPESAASCATVASERDSRSR